MKFYRSISVIMHNKWLLMIQRCYKMQIIRDKLKKSLQEENYKQALLQITELIAMTPNDGQLYLQKASILFKVDKYEQAIDVCHIAKAFHANSIQVTCKIIECQIQLHHVIKAQTTFQQFLSLRQDVTKLFELKNQIERLNLGINDKDNKILHQMKKWQYQSGANFDKLKVVEFTSNYRGVIAVSSIKSNQRIVFVPRRNFIDLQTAKQHPICANLIKNKTQLLSPKHSYLSIFLLSQIKKADSKWRHYFDSLPKDYSTFPINFSTTQLYELMGSPCLIQIHEKVCDLQQDYDSIISICPQMKEYSFKDYCWTRTIVGSRIFGVSIDGIKTQILVPFADMLNHKLPKQTVWNYSAEMNGFQIVSLFKINPGEEVFDSYGKKPNSRFLLNYGFVIQDNPDDQCFKINFQLSDHLFQQKLSMIKENGHFNKVLKTTINFNSFKFYQFMAYLRFHQIEDIKMLQILKKISKIQTTKQPYCPQKTPPLSIQLQLKVWRKLNILSKNALKQYPSSLQSDMELIKQMSLSQNIRNIITVRMGEKKILKYLIEMSEQAITAMSQEYPKCIQIITLNKDKQWAIYLAKMLNMLPQKQKIPEVINIVLQQQEEIIEEDQSN